MHYTLSLTHTTFLSCTDSLSHTHTPFLSCVHTHKHTLSISLPLTHTHARKHTFHQTKAALSRSMRAPNLCHSPWWIHNSWVVSRHANTAPPFQAVSRGSMSYRDIIKLYLAEIQYLTKYTITGSSSFLTALLVYIYENSYEMLPYMLNIAHIIPS